MSFRGSLLGMPALLRLSYDTFSANHVMETNITKRRSANRPRIGITMRLELESDRFYLSRYYSEAVEAAGGAPVHISLIPRPDYIAAVMDEVDGILLPGSDSDVDPLRYGAEPHRQLGTVASKTRPICWCSKKLRSGACHCLRFALVCRCLTFLVAGHSYRTSRPR